MNCPLQRQETADLLLDYSAGRLDAARTASLKRHIQTCALCAAFHHEQSAVWDALDTWEPTPVSMDFNRRLWQRIEEGARLPWYRRLGAAHWKPAIPLAAVVAMMAAAFLFDHPGPETNRMPGSGVSLTDADQVEQTLDDIQLLRQLDQATGAGASATQM